MNDFKLKDAIAKRKILPFEDGPELVYKEIQTAKEDLQDAKDVLKLGKHKLATIRAYYAIFHACRALLYKKKYREKSHIQLGFAIKALYIDTAILPEQFHNNFIDGLALREMADYKRKFSPEGAEKNIGNAEEAIRLAEKILIRPIDL